MDSCCTSTRRARNDSDAPRRTREGISRPAAFPYVVHDLANLLTCICTSAAAGGRDPTRAAASLRAIETAAARGADLLALLRGRSPPGTAAPVADVVDACRVLLECIGRDTNVSVTVDALPDVTPALPAFELQEIVLALGMHAIEAMPTGGQLRIGARAVDGALRIVIDDDGATDAAAPRAAVGVASAHDIVARAGGRIETGGPRFSVQLPFARFNHP